MIDSIEKYHYRGYVAKIVIDECPLDPMSEKNGDPVGTITYRMGARSKFGTEAVDQYRFNAIKATIQTGQCIGLPVFAYQHGSIMLKAAERNPFSCPWDSGQSGFVYCTREKACEEWGTAADKLAAALASEAGVEWKLSDKARDKALAYMAGEVETYSKYLNGECYGIVVEDRHGKTVDSVFGYYGLDDYLRDEAKRMVRDEYKAHLRIAHKER
jgi:hypothetical protein